MRAASWSSGQVVVVDPGQQPNRPAADDQVNLGALQADPAGLLEGDVVVLGQPGQTGDRDVVALVDGEGDGPLDQPLDPRWDGWVLGQSTGHRRTLAHPPDGPVPRAAGKRAQAWDLPGAITTSVGYLDVTAKRLSMRGDRAWDPLGGSPAGCRGG
jgi:hypothetical protein